MTVSNKKEEWVELQDAARILSRNSKRRITPDYVRRASHMGRIRRKMKDGRTNLYYRPDVEAIVVAKTTRGEKAKPQETATC